MSSPTPSRAPGVVDVRRATVPGATSRRRATVPLHRLALLHFRYGFLESVRVPVAVVGTTVFPALAMLFFVVPQRAVAGDPLVATAATAQLAVFAVMSTSVFSYGIGIAEERALPFDPYLRTLPAGPVPRMIGRVLNGTVFSILGVLPLVAVGWLLTEAALPWARLLAAVALLVVVGVPFLLIGLTIGYSLSAKAATAVAQVVVFPLAFAGGLFVPPETFPLWLDRISRALPSRGARDTVVSAATGAEVAAASVLVLMAWSAVFAVIVAAVYRRDEGRRFR